MSKFINIEIKENNEGSEEEKIVAEISGQDENGDTLSLEDIWDYLFQICDAKELQDEEEDMLEKEKEEKEYNDNNLTNIVNDIVNESEFGTATDKMLEILKYEEKKARLMETTTYIMSELTKKK